MPHLNPLDRFSRRQVLHAASALAFSGSSVGQPSGGPSAGQPPLDGAWQDGARGGRSLPWRLRLPAGPGPWPWIIYSHGLGGSRDGGAVWGQTWAAAGFAVLHLQHPGSDIETVRAGMAALRAAASAEQLLARVSDVRFAIAEVAGRAAAGQAPWAALRADALGMAGHSFGAVTTQAIAGQRHAVPGALSDPRPLAFIAFSPSPPRGGRPSLQQAFGDIARPFMAITGSLDGDPLAGLGGSAGSFGGAAARASVFEGLPPGQRALLWLDGADHATFGGGVPAGLGRRAQQRRDGRQTVALEREPAHHALVARISTQWWQAQLLGDGAARAALARAEGLAADDKLTLG